MINKGDSFESLLAPYIDNLYRLAYRYTGSQDRSEDLVQDLLIKLYPKYEYLKTIEKLRPWLARSLYNLFIDQVRRENNNPINNSESDEMLFEQQTDNYNLEQIINNDQISSFLVEAVNMLNAEQKALLSMHDLEGYTLVELTDVFNVPIGTLKSRLHRSRNKVKKILMSLEPL